MLKTSRQEQIGIHVDKIQMSRFINYNVGFDCKVERSVGTHDANTSALRWTLLGLGFRLFWSETYSFNGCGICVPLFLCYSWNHLFWIWIVAPIFGTQFVSFNSVLQGCMGSWYVGLVSMMSYFADTTTPEERNSVFVRGEAFLFLAFALGPYTGGLLSRLLPNGVQDVFLISLIGELLCVVYIILFLPESLKLTERKNSTSIVKIVKSSFSTLVTIFKWSNSSLVCVIVTTTLVGAALIGKGQFFYFVAFKFGWDSYDEGLFMMTSSLIRTFYMLAIFPLLVRLFSKLRSEKEGRLRFDLNLIRICLVIAALTSVALGVVPNSIGLYITSIFDGFVILASPILRSLVSNSVHSSQSAQLFSSVQFLEQAVGLVFGILFPLIWANSVGWMPNLILLMCGALYGLAALVMTFAGSEVVLV